MKTLSCFLFAGLLVLAGCGNSTDQNSDQQKHETEIVSEEETHEHDHGLEQINLNEGKKWKVDPKMLGYIRNMETSVSNFQGADYSNLTTSLKSDIDSLTTNCTMEGEAHDELHKWLVPYIELVDEMQHAKNDNEKTDLAAKVKSSLETFNTYFE